MVTQGPQKPTSFWLRIWRFLNTPISELIPWIRKRRNTDEPARLVAVEIPADPMAPSQLERGPSALSEVPIKKQSPATITMDLEPPSAPHVVADQSDRPTDTDRSALVNHPISEPKPEAPRVAEVVVPLPFAQPGEISTPINFTKLEEAKTIAMDKLTGGGPSFTTWRAETGYPPLLLIDVDLSGRSLNDSDWRNCVLIRVDFSGSHLKSSSFKEGVLYGCRFSGTEVEVEALKGQSPKELIGLSPFVLAQLLQNDDSNHWEEPVIPYQIRHEGKPWIEGEFVSQRVVFQNDSNIRLRFDILVDRNGHETRPIQRFLDPGRESFVNLTVESAAQDRAKIIVRIFPPDKNETYCLNSWRLPFISNEKQSSNESRTSQRPRKARNKKKPTR